MKLRRHDILETKKCGKDIPVLLEFLIIMIVFLLDQGSKLLTEHMIPLGGSIPVLPGVFELSNVHNTGMAWGLLPGGKWIFVVVTPLVCAGIAFLLIKRRKRLRMLARVCLSLLLAGAVGNLVDRIFLSYVRDMLYVSLINFPVFNVADSAVTIGAILLVIDMLFSKQGSVFSALEKAPVPTHAAEVAETSKAVPTAEQKPMEIGTQDESSGTEAVAGTHAQAEQHEA